MWAIKEPSNFQKKILKTSITAAYSHNILIINIYTKITLMSLKILYLANMYKIARASF